MQDEVIADVTGLEKISFGKPDAMELRALPKILKGEIKSAKEYKEYYYRIINYIKRFNLLFIKNFPPNFRQQY